MMIDSSMVVVIGFSVMNSVVCLVGICVSVVKKYMLYRKMLVVLRLNVVMIWCLLSVGSLFLIC